MRKEGPSRTARKVALNLVTQGENPVLREILPAGASEATARLLVASGAASGFLVALARSRVLPRTLKVFDRMMPGQFEAFAHRKAFFEREVRKAIGEGASQVIVLGAGYDTMTWRLAEEFPGVLFVELDHPGTAMVKARGIGKMGARQNLLLLADDLGEQSLREVLSAEERWDPAARSVFTAEGVLMYLEPGAVRELFAEAATVSGSGSRFLFTCVGSGPGGRPDAGRWSPLFLWALNFIGEPWLWGVDPRDLENFLRSAGWRLRGEVEALEKRGVEFFVTAEKPAE